MDTETKEHLEAMETRIGQRFEKMDQRFGEIDQRFEKIDRRFEKMEAENNKWFLKIYHQGTAMEARIEALEERVTALEREY